MRKQIAAANWKMNCTYQQGEKLLDDILKSKPSLQPQQTVIFAVPFPYLIMASSAVANENNVSVAAQNCYQKKSGAYTGEVSVEMLQSIGIRYCIIGHSERREYFHETNADLAAKTDLLLEMDIRPVFCCGEALEIREAGSQNTWVEQQLQESLFHLPAEKLTRIVIAYEPIWAIGTGKTASAAQAQEMHAFIRGVLAAKYGKEIADEISILYGGSVKAANAKEIFGQPDVDGGLVGGASLQAEEFVSIISALK
ncbi:triose-phosphate isomerase [Flavihumibacter petaseus]|uniref:Triosephosphate isomerase n=1 Tax=Flavihumibacter petaseus NBRC 106054 TaxID=1220578 RepID=A0A0E9N1R4_9BACT|nr:triose-phosphate isomerase [Flavihumibacter petaseus]GAO43957.1 triose-phosphate isomerase [Flavihumibacter petaseus NBRC 106054]